MLRPYLKKCGKFLKKPINFSVCAVAIELTDNQPFGDGSSNQMIEYMEIDHLKDTFQPLFSRLCEDNLLVIRREYTCGGSLRLIVQICMSENVIVKKKYKNWFIGITFWGIV